MWKRFVALAWLVVGVWSIVPPCAAQARKPRSGLAFAGTALRQRGTYGASLMIEFDANQVLDRPSLMPILHRLRSLGVDIALDERSGSLTRVPAMQLLPVTTLRIPRTTIGSMSPSEFSTAMGLWRASGRSVIVDQVDDVAAVMRLWSFGVDYLQGNGLAAPGPRLDYSGNDIEAAD